MNKKTTLLSLCLAIACTNAWAQGQNLPKVIDRNAQTVDMPVYGSPDADNIVPRRCPSSRMAAANNAATTRAISTDNGYVPHTGSPAIPVILVNFSNYQFAVNNPKEAFEQFFNGTTQTDLGNANNNNYGSVAQYFSDMSGGTFTPSFKILGPVTLSNGMKYYGGTKPNGSDDNTTLLAYDALKALQASSDSISDTAPYSSDGKTIDCVYLVYAGLGENFGGPDSAVWACTYNYNPTLKDKKVRWFSIASELLPFKTKTGAPMITGIGVTVHELSHALGLPDFYPTNPSARIDDQNMEFWDLMDGGEYGNNSYTPTAYTAFEKNEMGWPVAIEELSETQNVTMGKATTDGGTAYKITNPNNSNEYFMLELIHQSGWNSAAYGQGLLAYHVNRPGTVMTIKSAYNNVAGYPGMAVIPADSLCISSYSNVTTKEYLNAMRGDLFPGTAQTTELSDSSPRPNFCWYNTDFSWMNAASNKKLKTNRALTNIAYDETTGELNFHYISDVAAAIRQVNISDQRDDRAIYTLDGRYVGNSLQALPHGIYITGGRKVVK